MAWVTQGFTWVTQGSEALRSWLQVYQIVNSSDGLANC